MRILMIADFYWPYLGGVEQHVRTLSHALVELGHDVAVLTQKTGDLKEVEVENGVKIFRINTLMGRFSSLYSYENRPWAPPFFDPVATPATRKVMEEFQPDIVHGHDWLARSYIPLKNRFKAKFILSLHYYTISCAKKNLMFEGAPCSGPSFSKCLSCSSENYGAIKGPLVTVSNWMMAGVEKNRADQIISVTDFTAVGNGLSQESEPYSVIPNFINPDQSIDVSEWVDQLPEGPFIQYVGDFRRAKGFHILLEAYDLLNDPPPLVCIGKPWPDEQFDFPENIHQFHRWPNAAVMAAWERSVIGVAPSIWPEPFGIVVIEALVSGTPVIGSNVGGIPEIISHGEDGYLIEPNNAGELKEHLQLLIDNVSIRNQFSVKAKEKGSTYAVERVVREIESVYEQSILQPA